MEIESSDEPEVFRNFEKKGWDLSGQGYENHFTRLTSQAAGAMIGTIESGHKLLDVCTGPGMLASAAVKHGAEVIGIDLSSTMIGIAKKNVPEAEFYEGDAQILPFDDDSFDSVICGLGVIHLPTPIRAFNEMRRVVKSGGKVAVSTWEPPERGNGFGLLFASIKTNGDMNVPLPHGPDLFQFSEKDKMISALETSGYKDASVERVTSTWNLREPYEIIAALLEGTVRTRALLEAQTKNQMHSIVENVESAMEEFKSGDHYVVPMPMIVGSGYK